jgi:NAD(P)-dependent dehydrogenase (short-subunit alcohol dehydrogenase family)
VAKDGERGRAATAPTGKSRHRQADVRRAADLERLIRFAADTYGRLDILMSNAFSGRSRPVLEQQDALAARVEEGLTTELDASTAAADPENV